MTELSKDARKVAIASIQRYCKEELDFPIGNLRAGGLLDFFTTEIGSIIYNHALHDMQESLLARTDDAVISANRKNQNRTNEVVAIEID